MTWHPDLTDPRWLAAYGVLLFSATLIIMNLASGWWSLARHYRAEEPTAGRRLWWVSGYMGVHLLLSISYGNCLILTVAPDGFRLTLMFPFGLFSPPLFIPWSALQELEWQSYGLFGHFARMRLRGSRWLIAIRGRAGEQLRDGHAAWQASPAGGGGGPAAHTAATPWP